MQAPVVRRDEEITTDKGVTNSCKVVNPEDVAADTQVVVDALSFRKEFAFGNTDGCIASPSKEESI